MVLSIIAIISGIAVLSLRGNEPDTLAEQEAQRLYQLMQLASDTAAIKNRQYGIRFNQGGYQFYQLDQKQIWQNSRQKYLKSHKYKTELETRLRINGILVDTDESELNKAMDKKKLKPQIMLLSDGEIIPDFELTLINPATDTEFTIKPGDMTLLDFHKETLDENN